MSSSHVRIQLDLTLWFVPDDCILIRNDEPIALTARETKLLRLLLETSGYLERRSRNGKDEVDRPGQAWLAQEKRMRKAGRKCNHHLGNHQ